MTLSFKRTIDCFLVAMALPALTVGILAVFGDGQRATLASANTALASLHLKAKDLQLTQSAASSAHDPAPIDSAAAAFHTLQTISRTLQNLEPQAPADSPSNEKSTVSLLESYRIDYLALLASYHERNRHKTINQGLLDLIEQRLSLLPENLATPLRPSLESFRVQVTRFGQEGDGSQLSRLQSTREAITGLTSDPSLLTAIDTIIAECRHDLIDQEAIPPLEQAVGKKLSAFITQAETAIEGRSSLIEQRMLWGRRLNYGLIGALVVILALGFKGVRMRFVTFLDRAVQAEQAIRSGHWAGVIDPVPGDELGTRLNFLAETADRLRQDRAALHESDQHLQALLAVAEEWVLTCDPDQICIVTNPKAKSITGYDPAELIGKPLTTILEGNPTATLSPVLTNALADRKPFYRLDYEVQHLNGPLTPVIMSGHPLFTDDGDYQGFILAMRDRSADHHAEQQLEQASRTAKFLHQVLELALRNIELPELMDRFLDHLLEQSWLGSQPRAAFFLIDKQSNSLTMKAQRGLDSQVINSCSVLPVGTCLCGRAALSGNIVFADCNDPRHEMSYPGMAVHGHYCLPVHAVAGEIIGVVVLYLNPDYQRDSAIEAILANATTMVGSIIRRRQVEDELKAVNLDLEQRIELRTAQLSAANEELAAFAYSVSHDLRAPLRAISGFSEALGEDCATDLSPQCQEYLARISAGCLRMESLIGDILDLSRLTRQELQRENVEISRMAEEIGEEIRAESPHRMVEWKIAPGIEALADPTMIRVVLTNLLANAWKYSQYTENARIELGRLRTDAGETVVFVKDNGAGFDMRYAAKLFKPFQRLHPHDQFAGNGIGLATVQRIVHRHGGRIWAEGEVGVGATFYFTLSPPGTDRDGIDLATTGIGCVKNGPSTSAAPDSTPDRSDENCYNTPQRY